MTKIFLIGIYWILLGIFNIFARNYESNEISVLNLSIDSIISSIFSLIFIVIGIFFIFGKRWAHKAALYLSKVLIFVICGIGIKTILDGILDLNKTPSLASSIGLFIGFIIFVSSIPFFIMIVWIKNKEIENHFYKSMIFKKSYANIQQKVFSNRHKKMLVTIYFLAFFVGMVAFTFVLSSLDKILYWDEIVDLGKYNLSVRDWGKGKPTVIIEGGLNQEKNKYFLISFFTSFTNRTIAYDHAGIGNSTKSPDVRLLPNYIEELRRLMKKKDISPPVIFVGHSSGGHIVRYYTYLYPLEVSGIVFIDVPHEDWFKHIRENWSKEEIIRYFKWWYPENPDMTNMEIVEKSKYEENCNLVKGKIIPDNIPVLMFIGKNKPHFRKDHAGMIEDMKVWADQQSSLVKNLDNAEVIIDWETGHFPFKDKPIMVVKNINRFIKKIRDGIEGGGLQ